MLHRKVWGPESYNLLKVTQLERTRIPGQYLISWGVPLHHTAFWGPDGIGQVQILALSPCSEAHVHFPRPIIWFCCCCCICTMSPLPSKTVRFPKVGTMLHVLLCNVYFLSAYQIADSWVPLQSCRARISSNIKIKFKKGTSANNWNFLKTCNKNNFAKSRKMSLSLAPVGDFAVWVGFTICFLRTLNDNIFVCKQLFFPLY